jgi:hypothetical protein
MNAVLRFLLAGAAALGLAAPAGALVLPQPVVPEADRVSVSIRDLDGRGPAEQVWVYNMGQGTSGPETWMTVWKRVTGGWTPAFRARLYGPGPGNPQSGLMQAWVSDLNADGRVEVMARNDITASAGEVLVVMRQRARRSLAFSVLQRITGDEVTVRRGTPARPAAVVTSRILANHAPDNRAHAETWTWSARPGRWTCTADCRGGTQAGVFADPAQAAVSGLAGLGPTRVISTVRRDLLPGDTRDPSATRLYMVTFELLRATPVLPAGVHMQFAYVVRSGSGWRLASMGTGP